MALTDLSSSYMQSYLLFRSMFFHAGLSLTALTIYIAVYQGMAQSDGQDGGRRYVRSNEDVSPLSCIFAVCHTLQPLPS